PAIGSRLVLRDRKRYAAARSFASGRFGLNGGRSVAWHHKLLEHQKIMIRSGLHERFITLGPPIPEELPDIADFANQVEVHVGDDDIVVVALADGEELPAWITKIALAVKLTDPPGLFQTGPVDRSNEILVGDRMRRLLQFPQVLGQAGNRRRRIEHNLRAVKTKAACAFREMAVITDVGADLAGPRFENRIAEVPRPKIKFLPEAGLAVRDVHLAKLAQVLAVRVDHRGGVIVNPRQIFFVDGHDQDHAVLLGTL